MSFPHALCRSALLCTLVAAPAFAAAQGLTLREAQRLALERSTQIAAREAEARAGREMAVAAAELPDPVLRFGVENLPVEGPEAWSLTRDFMTMRRIGFMQEFPREEKRALRARRAQDEAGRALAARGLAASTIRRDTARAWLEAWFLQEARQTVAAQGDEARLAAEAAEAAYRGRRGSQADVFAARAAVGAIGDQLDQVERKLAASRVWLARWTGEAGAGELGPAPNLTQVSLDEAGLDAAIARHPQLSVLDRRVDLAQTEARLAAAEKKIDWSLELAYQKRGPAFSDMVSVMVSLPLQWNQARRQDREEAAKLALRDQARAEREDAQRTALAELRALFLEWRSGRSRLARYVDSLVPLAESASRAALAAYRGGTGPLQAVLAARRAELDTRLAALQLEAEAARAWAELEFLFPELEATTARAPKP